MEARLGTQAADKSAEIEQARAELGKTTAEIKRIEAEVDDLRTKETQLENEFADYRKRYPMPADAGN